MAQTSHRLSLKFGNENVNSGNFENCFNTINNSDEDAKIMHWLTPIEPGKRHDGVRTERLEGVGNWLLETTEFQEWSRGECGPDKAVLFCSGNPGVGKTYLSSVVIDRLCDKAREERLAVAWLYCDHGARREQTVINIMGAILKRLVCSEIPEDIRNAFQEGRRPLLPDLIRILRAVVASLPQTFICIDALDECLPETLAELLKSLKDIIRGSPKTRIFLTGRPHVREIIQNYFSEEKQEGVVLHVNPKSGDIKNYLEWRLDKDTDREAMSDDLREDIVRIILEKMSDSFLLASLNIELILGGTTVGRRRKKLEETEQGNGLSDAYKATLNRLKEQGTDKRELGLKALMWVLYSERPLGVEELRHALGVEMDSADIDPKNAPAIRIIRSCCLGLLTVEESSSTVRLVHFTLQEHLSSDLKLFHNPHSTIAEVCLSYLNSGPVKELSPTLSAGPSTMPLLEYASYYWGEHARRGLTENVKILALKLLDRFDEHISAGLLLLHNDEYGFIYTDFPQMAIEPTGFTGLHGVAFFGIAEIVPPVLDMNEWDIKAVDRLGCTALTWAARNGHAEAIQILLERKDVNPDQAVTRGGATPLWIASREGHQGVVKILLERADVNPDQADTQNGVTPLWIAACNGREGVVKTLLEREDVNPDLVGIEYGATPLWVAAHKGHEGVVKILLAREDVNPDLFSTEDGATPLWIAARKGHEGIVKMLLEQESVNPDLVGTEYGVTPLWIAAHKGHEGVVKMLLEREDVNPDHASTAYGATPLLIAAQAGQKEVVKILLEREDVNPDRRDAKYGATPLLAAANEGHEGVVEMLLDRGRVNPDLADIRYGRTPLGWAAKNGDDSIVMMLLDRGNVNPDRKDTRSGATPLLLAAREGHEGVVKMLLDRGGVNPDRVDTKYGRTPLGWAAKNGNDGVVKMLLDQKGANPNLADTKSGRTPLSWAAKGGYEGIVKMLLEREDINSNLEIGENTWMPLSWKVGNGRVEIVKVTKGEDDLEYADRNDSEDSDWGRMYPHILISEGSEDSSDSDSGGSEPVGTPQPLALRESHDGVERILVGPGNSNLDKVDHGDQSSLPLSPGHRDEFAVEIRFRSQDVNPDITDSNSQHSLPPVDSNEQEPVPDPKGPVSRSPDNDPPTTESPALPPASSMWPLKFLYPPWRSNIHPNNTRSTLPILVNLCWVIRSCLFLLASLASLRATPNRTLPHDAGVALVGKVRRFFVFSLLKLGLGNWYRQDLRRVRRR